MIPATTVPWFARLFAGHARSRIFGTFGRVMVSGLGELRAATERGPVLIVANHTTWWDPLVALWLTRGVLGVDAYAMMNAANLRRLPFFGKVGAFGVDLDDPRDGARAIRYAAKLLGDRRLVWIFPEGRERSPYEPLDLLPGAAAVGRLKPEVPLVAIGIRYVFAGNEKPDLWIAISRSLVPERAVDAGVVQQRDAIAVELARIGGSDFELLHDTTVGVFARFAEAALSFLVRFF